MRTFVVALAVVTLVPAVPARAAPRPDQTVVIRDGKIAEVGPAQTVRVPAGVRTMDLSGSTVIPGLVGMHDHLFYTAAGSRFAQMSYTGQRLYLAAGVTTIRTTGSRSPYAEINLKDQIDRGLEPGPRIHITAPYITGPQGGAMMAVLASPEAARRFVAYWAAEGATWIKAYTDIRRAELGAAIAEAHKQGIKVTGHLCSVTLKEAVALGIDNLEHGMFAASDFDPTKAPDVCPAHVLARVNDADAHGDVAQATIRTLVDHHISMTSTLAVVQPFATNRPTNHPPLPRSVPPAVHRPHIQVIV